MTLLRQSTKLEAESNLFWWIISNNTDFSLSDDLDIHLFQHFRQWAVQIPGLLSNHSKKNRYKMNVSRAFPKVLRIRLHHFSFVKERLAFQFFLSYCSIWLVLHECIFYSNASNKVSVMRIVTSPFLSYLMGQHFIGKEYILTFSSL